MCRTLRSFGVFVALLILFLTVASNAQRQIAFDDGGHVFVLTKQLEQRVKLFNLPGFEEARIFGQPDSTFLLEITVADSLGFRRTSRTITLADIQSMRQQWRRIMGAGPPDELLAATPAEPLSEEGRARMVQTITGLGIGWYGWTFPAMLGDDSGPLPFTLYLLTAGVTYFAADGFLADRSYSDAEASAFMYFATRGIIHGYALNTLITGAYDELRTGFPAGTVVSLVEGLTISRWAARNQIPVGRMKAIGTVGDAGLLLGLGTAYATSPSDRPFFDDASERPRSYAVGVLTGNAAGILAGLWLAERDQFAPGDADLMESAGYLGAAAGFMISDLSKVTDRRSHVLAAMAGLTVGGAIGGRLAMSKDLTSTEGRRVGLLTSGGVLVGLGIAYAIDQSARRSHYWTFSTLGGIAGFLVASSTIGSSSERGSLGARMTLRPEGFFQPVTLEGDGPFVRVRPFMSLTVSIP